MLSPTKLRIRGFRGFMSDQVLTFDTPVVFLYGENRRGKSSTLNAIEWCLFGKECAGLGTGIRERVDWVFANRNMRLTDVAVEMELGGPEGRYVIQRSLRPRGRRGGDSEELRLTVPDGTALSGDQARQRLGQLLMHSSFSDFMTAVYQHQETIRAVLTQEPRDRNDAIDRLLGLSDYRNLLDGISSAKLPTKQKGVADRFSGFEQKVEVLLAARKHDLAQKRQIALDNGVADGDLNVAGALRLAGEVMNSLTRFASALNLQTPTVRVPDEWHGLREFVRLLRAEISRMRGEIPGVAEITALLQRRTELTALKAEYEGAKAAYDNAIANLARFEREHGDGASIAAQISRTQQSIEAEKEALRKANARGALVREAIKFLEQADIQALGNRCPVCGNEARDLLAHLKQEWEQRIQVHVEEIGHRLQALEEELARLTSLQSQHKQLADRVRTAKALLKEVRNRVGEALRREITDADDALALLDAELARINGRLKELEDAVTRRQQELSSIEERLEKVLLIVDVLEMEEKIKAIEKIKECDEYKNLERLRDQIAQFVEDVERIKEAVRAASNEEAATKIASARQSIDHYFQNLTDHPAVTEVKLTVEFDALGRNSYKLKDQHDKDLSPILNQGDLNALALAIFLGLACASGDAQRFGFLMLDDPSQSLGSQYKRRLAEVLEEVSGKKRIILSTMDRELQELLVSVITKPKTTYTFSGWTPSQGPEIRRG